MCVTGQARSPDVSLKGLAYPSWQPSYYFWGKINSVLRCYQKFSHTLYSATFIESVRKKKPSSSCGKKEKIWSKKFLRLCVTKRVPEHMRGPSENMGPPSLWIQVAEWGILTAFCYFSASNILPPQPGEGNNGSSTGPGRNAALGVSNFERRPAEKLKLGWLQILSNKKEVKTSMKLDCRQLMKTAGQWLYHGGEGDVRVSFLESQATSYPSTANGCSTNPGRRLQPSFPLNSVITHVNRSLSLLI